LDSRVAAPCRAISSDARSERSTNEKQELGLPVAASRAQSRLVVRREPIMSSAAFRCVVGICSCRGHSRHRRVIRETWMSQRIEEITGYFFIGKEDVGSESGLVQLECDDMYGGLPYKVQSFCRWLLRIPDWDYLFKCDDDTYLYLDRLPRLAHLGDFVGSADTARDGFASGGAGYLVSRECVAIVANAPDVGPGREDLWVSRLLLTAGKHLVASTSLRMDSREVPAPTNDLVSAHWCSPEMMASIHAGMSGAPLCTFDATHSAWSGNIALYSNGVFLGGGSLPNGRWELCDANEILLLRWFDWEPDKLIKTPLGYSNGQLQLVRHHPAARGRISPALLDEVGSK